MTTHNNLAPTSPRPRPSAGGDLRNRRRPSPPSPTGGDVELAPNGHPVENTTSPQPQGATSTNHHPILYTCRTGSWSTCLCGWKSTTQTTVIGAHLAFGGHLVACGLKDGAR